MAVAPACRAALALNDKGPKQRPRLPLLQHIRLERPSPQGLSISGSSSLSQLTTTGAWLHSAVPQVNSHKQFPVQHKQLPVLGGLIFKHQSRKASMPLL